MRELFPTNVKPGSRLTTGWINGVGTMLNRQFVPGSSMSGIRSGGFDADMSPLATVTKVVEVTRFVDEETGEPEDENFKPGIIVEERETQPRYFCKVLSFREVGEATDAKRYEYDDDDTSYLLDVLWQERQLLLPAYLRYDDGVSGTVPGDRVLATWDPLSGNFSAIAPPTARIAKTAFALGDVPVIQPLAAGKVEVYFNEALLAEDNSGIKVNAVNLLAEDVEDEVGVRIEYFQPMRRWFITQQIVKAQAIHIHFTLGDDLSGEDPFAAAGVDDWYEGSDPSEDTDDFLVWNPPAGCTGTPFRFHGPAGCKGQAIYSHRDKVFWIWQLDCPQG